MPTQELPDTQEPQEEY